MTVTEATNITKNPAPVDAICETKKRKKKPIRQAIGVLVIDKKAKRVLLISSRKREGAFVLPRGDCNEAEEPAQAALRILFEEAGVFASQCTTPCYLKIGLHPSNAIENGQPLRRHLEQQQTVQCPTWL